MRAETAWRKKAACRQMGLDPEMFFVSDEARRLKGADKELTPAEVLAIEVCMTKCPVSGNCLAYALDNPQEVGIWGGTTTLMRKALRRVRSRATCPRCMKDSLTTKLDDTQICLQCGLTWHWI